MTFKLFETVIDLLNCMSNFKYKEFIDLPDAWISSELAFSQPVYVSRLANPQTLNLVNECGTLIISDAMIQQLQENTYELV